ncbi:MAG: SpoIIE family protein phosphatase [Spirochaetota bacterium]
MAVVKEKDFSEQYSPSIEDLQAWSVEMRKNGMKWHTWLSWTIITIYPSWSIFDYLLVYQHWQSFAIIRFVGAFLIAFYLLLASVKKWQQPVFLGYLSTLVMYLSIAYIISYTGEMMWFYSLGYCAAFIGANLLLYWKIWHSIISIGITSIFYVLCFSLFAKRDLIEMIAGGGFLTLTLALVSIILLAIRMALYKKEFFLRRQLLTTQNQLQERLDDLSALQYKQNGDYYLTSQLIKPLSIHNIDSEFIEVKALIRQKKQFTFRRWQEQLGGDINIANRIKLNSQPYIVAMNADAMGKSMQGAGGALVLGAVFQSIVQRTISQAIFSNMSPEEWIRTVFKELHNIFKSFKGFMFVSMVLCLVNEKTGFVYYINAEHPWVTLYRDGVASFIEKELAFRKLGVVGVRNELYISTFKLLPGDTLIIGSDGKDDLIPKNNGSLDKKINLDEYLFLQKVEENRGDVEQIFAAILDEYELVDDFSLLSISYPMAEKTKIDSEQLTIKEAITKCKKLQQENKIDQAIALLQGLHQSLGSREVVLKHLIHLYTKQKDYRQAEIYFKEYIQKNEATSILFKASFCMKTNGNLNEAMQLADRIRLREPSNVKNLAHLAEMYAQQQKQQEVEKISAKIYEIKRNNLSNANVKGS